MKTTTWTLRDDGYLYDEADFKRFIDKQFKSLEEAQAFIADVGLRVEVKK